MHATQRIERLHRRHRVEFEFLDRIDGGVGNKLGKEAELGRFFSPALGDNARIGPGG